MRIPELSDESIEGLLVALLRAQTVDGDYVAIPLRAVFTEEFLKQVPFIHEDVRHLTSLQ